MSTNFDTLIIGAGFAGAIVARELAEQGNQKVLVLESRDHVGGNAFDCLDSHGILIHQYGPHIFHTANKEVFDYLSRFTTWLDYQHRVVANVHGQMMPVPFNLDSLHQAFPQDKADRMEQLLIETYGENSRVTILELRENPNAELQELADYVYENVFVHYTMKQWEQTPEEIDPATTARVPVLISRDDRYFQDPYQGMPTNGYTPMFEQMLNHPNITLCLSTPAESRLTLKDGITLLDGEVFSGNVIYTGPVDALFALDYGRLPYRTLDFGFETLNQDQFQPRATVNYTVSEAYTRITEFKLLTGQTLAGKTTIMKEYSRAYTGAQGETPYYSIINPENNALYGQYKARADQYSNLHLLGRLAEYKYYNMDAIADRALALSKSLLSH